MLNNTQLLFVVSSIIPHSLSNPSQVMSQLLTYSELIAQIRELCRQKKTGTVFVTSEEGYLIRFVLKTGQVVHLVFDAQHRGYEAIPLIHTIKKGRLQFAEGILETADEGGHLPPTEELLQTLELFQQLRDSDSITLSAPKVVLGQFKTAIKQVQRNLAFYIGPFANIVCEDYIRSRGTPKLANDVLTMIDAIAKEIDPPKKQEEFKEITKEILLERELL